MPDTTTIALLSGYQREIDAMRDRLDNTARRVANLLEPPSCDPHIAAARTRAVEGLIQVTERLRIVRGELCDCEAMLACTPEVE